VNQSLLYLFKELSCVCQHSGNVRIDIGMPRFPYSDSILQLFLKDRRRIDVSLPQNGVNHALEEFNQDINGGHDSQRRLIFSSIHLPP
jgi:hypothetical protein